MKKSFLFCATTFLIFTNCGKSEEPEQEDILQEFPDIAVVNINQETGWDYWVGGKEDYYFVNASEGLPESLLYHSEEAKKDYTVFFTENGLIDKVVVENYTLLLRNFNGFKFDVGIIYPNGDIEILRELETDFNWDNLVLGKASDLTKVSAWSDVVRWTGRIVQGVPCALSAVAASSSGGLFTPLFIGTCSSYLLTLSADIAANEFKIQNGFTELVNFYDISSTAYSCQVVINPTECLVGLAGTALSNIANDLEEIENNTLNINAINAMIQTGYGDIQVNLTWDNETDLDLHVFDPIGNEVFYDNPNTSYGMTLDVDDTDGIGPENIYWNMQNAPTGIYSVFVNFYDGISVSSNYTVLISAFGITKKFTGTILQYETVLILNFDPLQFNLGSKTINKNNIIEVSKRIKSKKL